MTDVRLFHTSDGGEITIEGGIVELGGGLPTAVYLSLFGGNIHDSGSVDNPNTWWGNRSEPGVRQYRSRTQNVTKTLVAIPANLKSVEDAAETDLEWLITEGVASSVRASASIPAREKVGLSIQIVAEGQEYEFNYIENWRSES